MALDPAAVGAAAAALATLGWLYTARRSWALARKQHTINVMMNANLNQQFREQSISLTPYIRANNVPVDLLESEDREDLRQAFRFVLNHYEFVAAGIRNGDFNERLVRDSQRSTFVLTWQACEQMIWRSRNSRSRMTTYEHLEWLVQRWTSEQSRWQRFTEWAIARPLRGRSYNPLT